MEINTDAAFTVANGGGATAAVLHNEKGDVLAAAARAYSNVVDALIADALAARDGVLLATEQGAMKVLLETNNAMLVSLLSSDEGIRSAIADI